MPMLDCNVRTCYYNKEYRCCLDNIHVEGRDAETSRTTDCGSYKERTGDSFSNSCSESPQMELTVDCEAEKCKYNDDCQCHADHIGIAGSSAHTTNQTECSTFTCY